MNSGELNQQQLQTAHVLQEIRSLPLPLDTPLYRHYPGMKLGQPPLVEFYARQLAAIAAGIVHSDFDGAPWVITAPPFFHLPAAANLMADHVCKDLQQQGLPVTLAELRLTPPENRLRDEEEFKNSYNYSKNTLQQRIRERERVQQMLDPAVLRPQFAGRKVIVINDINVTGTQQHFIAQTLAQLQVEGTHWLYIFQVEPALAAAHPEIEHQINHSQLADDDSYIAVLSDAQTRHTARCISRLFNEDMAGFQRLVGRLTPPVAGKILLLASREGRYANALFGEKMSLLAQQRQLCTA